MNITKATFDCTIAMPGYANVKPGASEIVLAPGEQIEDAWTELDRRAKAWHQKSYPHLYDAVPNPGPSLPEGPLVRSKQPEQERIALLIADIYSCPDLKILESYQLMVKKDPQLQAAYDMQLQRLNTPKTQINY